jgi:PAS domain S-box-containing protein
VKLPPEQPEEQARAASHPSRILEHGELLFYIVMQAAHDAVILADRQGIIRLWNNGARTIFGYAAEDIVGRPLVLLMPERYREAHQHGLARLQATGEWRAIGKTLELHGLRKDGSEFPLELSLDLWKAGDEMFYSGIIRDITERKQAEEERERLVAQLQEALGKVRTLQGLLPICAWCKKIRDDQGYWGSLETYITEHSQAQFTHAMCSDCLQKHCPGLPIT